MSEGATSKLAKPEFTISKRATSNRKTSKRTTSKRTTSKRTTSSWVTPRNSEQLEPRLLLASDLYWQPVTQDFDSHDSATYSSAAIEDAATIQATDSNVLPASVTERFTLDYSSLKKHLASTRGNETRSAGTVVISLPDANGDIVQFRASESTVMAPELAARFPQIATYSATGIDGDSSKAWLVLANGELHAQVNSTSGWHFIEPSIDADVYSVSRLSGENLDSIPHDGHGESRRVSLANDVIEIPTDRDVIVPSSHHKFLAASDEHFEFLAATPGVPLAAQSGTQLRTYRLAVAATGEYTNFHGGTLNDGLAAIVNAVSAVNAIFETELSIRFELVANNDRLISIDANTDPYTGDDHDAMVNENRAHTNTEIGAANYDIGHVFSTNSGGLAFPGVVGDDSYKAGASSGAEVPQGPAFIVDVFAHELGHQFGARHSFNGSHGDCGANRNSVSAFEPGSGSTIMSYAGSCEADDLQEHADPFFHAHSLEEIIEFVDITIPNVGTRTSTGNSIPTVDAGSDFTIPANTPFELSADGNDSNPEDQLTYSWEQFDRGTQRSLADGDGGSGPLFRAWPPTTSPTRSFPRLTDLLANTTSPGETLPTTNRTMRFQVTARDNFMGGGGINSDEMNIHVVDTGAGFQVTSPNSNVTWPVQSQQSVTWNVAGTTTNGIDASEVNILLSSDGGQTFSTVLASAVPNDGEHQISLPFDAQTSNARIRVEANDNIFFDVSDFDFVISDPIHAFDFGDAPDVPYQTLDSSTGAKHRFGGPILGIDFSSEADSSPNADAIGDTADDGVSLLEPLIAGTTVDIAVASSTGGVLDYFFDFDGTGGFGNQGNEILTANLNAGTQLVSVPVPATALGAVYARFRISSAGGLGPIGEASDGEVEDYRFEILDESATYDFGDADNGYATLNSANGPQHYIAGAYLGTAPNGDSDGQPNSSATTDSDDGVWFDELLIPGTTAHVMVDSSAPAVLDYFFDFDANGIFGNRADEIFSANVQAGSSQVPVEVPNDAVFGTTYARFRLSRLGGLGPTGFAHDGEVEDYQVEISGSPSCLSDAHLDFDSVLAPSLPFGWNAPITQGVAWNIVGSSSESSPNHAFVPNVDYQADATLSSPVIVIPHNNPTLAFQNHYDIASFFDGAVLEISVDGGEFVDILDHGTFVTGGYNELIFGNSSLGGRNAWTGDSGGFIETQVDLDNDLVGRDVQFRWQLSTDDSIADAGWRIDSLQICGDPVFDFGDAPDPAYATLLQNEGAAHADGGFYSQTILLGTVGNLEPDAQPNSDATGDQGDDGVVLPSDFTGGQTETIVVTTTADAILNAWIDWNGDGSWSSDEQIFKDKFLASGASSLPVEVPSSVMSTGSFARFRLSQQAGLLPIGKAPSGEVEDYAVTLIPDLQPPAITSVRVGASTGGSDDWSHAFLDEIDSEGIGYTVPHDASQTTPLPWGNIRQIYIQFSEDIGNIDLNQVDLWGVETADYRDQLSIAYSPETRLATLTLAAPINVDALRLMVYDTVTDLGNNRLDGDWTTGGSLAQSGDETAGGNFDFRFNVAPGDTTQSRTVSVNDLGLLRVGLGRGIGESGYSILADLNGSGHISVDDVSSLRSNLGLSVPTQTPGPVASVSALREPASQRNRFRNFERRFDRNEIVELVAAIDHFWENDESLDRRNDANDESRKKLVLFR